MQSFAQNEERVNINGYTLNSEQLQAIPLTNISTRVGKERFISNRKGFFHMRVHPKDTLHFSAIGFAELYIPVQNLLHENQNDTLIILMTSVSYQLKEVKIVPNRERDSIARIVAKLLMHDSLLNNYDRVYKRPRGKLLVSPYLFAPGIIYEGPITELYNRFSKEGKDYVRFEEFVKYAKRQQIYDEKYNKEMVKKVTDIDDSDLDEFMMFCKPDKDFVINSNEYDLNEFVKKCAANFKEEQKKERTRLR
ncbi:MAG: hypothetical protein ACHQK8_08920 [Bacteroidia bacterium]